MFMCETWLVCSVVLIREIFLGLVSLLIFFLGNGNGDGVVALVFVIGVIVSGVI